MLRGSRPAALAAGLLLLLAVAAPAWGASGTAPGAPGTAPNWTPANKDGFGTATSPTSKVWHTLSNGELTEVYYLGASDGWTDLRDDFTMDWTYADAPSR